MNNPRISIIVAMTRKDRGIGLGNKLLWHIPQDLKHFKEITTGHPIIMGRKTYESIGRPLPNRTNIIVSRNNTYTAQGCIVVDSLEKAIEQAKSTESSEIFIIGGGEIFKQALPLTHKLYLTLVEGSFEADVFFPNYSTFTKVLKEETYKSDGYTYTFVELAKT